MTAPFTLKQLEKAQEALYGTRLGRNEYPLHVVRLRRSRELQGVALSLAAMLAWSSCEFPLAYLPWDQWKRLLRDAPKKMRDGSSLPLKLYRGDDSAGWSKTVDNNASWTTDEDTAVWFANRMSSFANLESNRVSDTLSKPLVLEMSEPKPEWVIAVYDPLIGRDEHEVILDPYFVSPSHVTIRSLGE